MQVKLCGAAEALLAAKKKPTDAGEGLGRDASHGQKSIHQLCKTGQLPFFTFGGAIVVVCCCYSGPRSFAAFGGFGGQWEDGRGMTKEQVEVR